MNSNGTIYRTPEDIDAAKARGEKLVPVGVLLASMNRAQRRKWAKDHGLFANKERKG